MHRLFFIIKFQIVLYRINCFAKSQFFRVLYLRDKSTSLFLQYYVINTYVPYFQNQFTSDNESILQYTQKNAIPAQQPMIFEIANKIPLLIAMTRVRLTYCLSSCEAVRGVRWIWTSLMISLSSLTRSTLSSCAWVSFIKCSGSHFE